MSSMMLITMVVTKNHILYNQVQDLQGRVLVRKCYRWDARLQPVSSFGWLQLNPDNHPSWLGVQLSYGWSLGAFGWSSLSLCGCIYSRIVSCFMLSKHPLPLTKIPLVDMGYHMLCKHSFITDVGYHKSCKHPHADIFLSWWDFTDLKCF